MASYLVIFGFVRLIDTCIFLISCCPPIPFPSLHVVYYPHDYKCCFQSESCVYLSLHALSIPHTLCGPRSRHFLLLCVRKSNALQAAQAAFLREYKLVVVGGGGEPVCIYSGLALALTI